MVNLDLFFDHYHLIRIDIHENRSSCYPCSTDRHGSLSTYVKAVCAYGVYAPPVFSMEDESAVDADFSLKDGLVGKAWFLDSGK